MSELGYGTGIAEAAAAGSDALDGGQAAPGAGYEGTPDALDAEDGLPPRQEVSDAAWSDSPEWDEADLAGGYDGDLGAISANDQLPPRQEVNDTAWRDTPEWDEADLADEYDGDLDALTAEENSPARPDAQGNASAPDQSADGPGDSAERDGVSPSIADRKNSSESTDLVDAKPARMRGIVSASNVAMAGALIDVYDTVAKFPAHATPLEVAVPMAATILGLSAWGLDKIEKHKKREAMIVQINAKVEKALREAMGHVAYGEASQVEHALAVLDERERAEALRLAVLVTCYVMIDVCDGRWPNQASVQQIAGDLATTGTTASRLNLDAEEIYAYLWRVVAGPEQLEDVIPDEPMFTRFPVIVAQRATVVYRPKDLDTWDYLDKIESAIENASALDPQVLPAAVMRAYLSKPEAGGRATRA